MTLLNPGDPKVGYLEGVGGRPTIVGDWHRTQDVMLDIVRGTYKGPEGYQPQEVEPEVGPRTRLGKAVVALAERFL